MTTLRRWAAWLGHRLLEWGEPEAPDDFTLEGARPEETPAPASVPIRTHPGIDPGLIDLRSMMEDALEAPVGGSDPGPTIPQVANLLVRALENVGRRGDYGTTLWLKDGVLDDVRKAVDMLASAHGINVPSDLVLHPGDSGPEIQWGDQERYHEVWDLIAVKVTPVELAAHILADIYQVDREAALKRDASSNETD